MAQYINPQQLMHNPAGPGSAAHYSRMTNPPAHPSAQRAHMPAKFVLPDGKQLVHLPRPVLFTPALESIPPITFSTNGFPGVRVRDVLKAMVLVDRPNDQIFEQHGWRTTNVSLEWPGYDIRAANDPSHLRMNLIVDGAPITRNRLAGEICSLLWNYNGKMQGKPITRGHEQWALHPDVVRVSDVWLLSLHYYRSVWVPEFYIKF
ncbi:hypothetical protein BJ138DRAFT_927141 [Hygrophoropsis aurantiaca]|uniref:Uncharacterized protein n=1 Tax=Hygrophoropsis aurantiaca TaxID=72124 RepID=A0ACB7ZUJ9_9AGAM|nr:hypothetical protein BJ138DRAFT_927141 [Hygrophoropsis aurantiaca]